MEVICKWAVSKKMAKKLRKYPKIKPTQNPFFLLISDCIHIQVYKSGQMRHTEQEINFYSILLKVKCDKISMLIG